MVQKILKTDCIACVWGCGINAYVKDGKLVKVEGMTEHPLNQGELCPKGAALVDYVYSPGYTVTETTVVSEPYYEETVVYDEYYLYP